MKQLSICTYNILAQSYTRHNIREGSNREFCLWSHREHLLQEFLSTQQETAIIGLQEVEPSAANSFKKGFSSHQFFYTQRAKSPDGLFLIINNQCQIDNFQEIPLYNESGIPRRVAQIVDCSLENKQFRIVNLHLDYDARGRNGGFVQLKQVLNLLDTQKEKPTLIFGDFNITPRRRTFDFLIQQGFSAVDTSQPTCYTGRWSRVDHIFYTPDVQIRGLQIPEANSVRIPNETWGSDHLPIVCQFEI